MKEPPRERLINEDVAKVKQCQGQAAAAAAAEARADFTVFSVGAGLWVDK